MTIERSTTDEPTSERVRVLVASEYLPMLSHEQQMRYLEVLDHAFRFLPGANINQQGEVTCQGMVTEVWEGHHDRSDIKQLGRRRFNPATDSSAC